MFKAKLPHMLCAKCGAKVAREAYYCKSCGEVIDDVVAPGSKNEDTSFISQLKYAISRHLIRNTIVGIFLILFAATGIKLGINYLNTTKDNGSSAIYKLTVVSPSNPMTCRGAICHINIDVENKTNTVQVLNAIPDLVTSAGKQYAPADPSRMGNGSNYCQPKIALTLRPHQSVRYLGICAQDMPIGTKVALAELRDSSGASLVSGPFKGVSY